MLNEFYIKIIDILLTFGNECIPSRSKRPKFTKPGWNMFCEEPRQKSDGKVSSMSNFIVYSAHILSVYLSLLFNSLIIHGFTPDEMLTGTIIPIPKSKRKSIHDSSNYRGIALSSIFGKIVDNIILKSNSEVLKCCDLQFGFRSSHSTSQCTFVLKEIVQYYTNNDINAYCMLLDASEAFDHVHYIKLFKLLIERGICPVIARFLLNFYLVSPTFSVSNGVKQGGVLSPILFCVYMNELLYRLRLSGFGCHVGNISIPAISYANDVALLVPTISSLKLLLNLVNSFGNEYCVKIILVMLLGQLLVMKILIHYVMILC